MNAFFSLRLIENLTPNVIVPDESQPSFVVTRNQWRLDRTGRVAERLFVQLPE